MGILSFYLRQKQLLKKLLEPQKMMTEGISVEAIDSSQGLEFDVVVCTVARTDFITPFLKRKIFIHPIPRNFHF